MRPTVLEGSDPADEIFTTEYFGPILAVHVYPDADYAEMLAQAADVTPVRADRLDPGHGPRGDRPGHGELRYSAGNFYINDKPTGAVVGQQPFGGARASGTDDKAGSIFNLIQVGVRARRSRNSSCPRPTTATLTWVDPSHRRTPFTGWFCGIST